MTDIASHSANDKHIIGSRTATDIEHHAGSGISYLVVASFV